MEEMLDIYDVDGNFVGTKSRSFCHSENAGVYHKSVWIWIINSKGEILVQKRTTGAKKWDMSSSGHVAAGETCLAGCVRETFEELGIVAKEKEFTFLGEFFRQNRWEFAQVYLLKKDIDIKDMKLQVEEVECVRWLPYDEFVEFFFSDKFCSHPKEYKDWIVKILKESWN